MTERRRPTKADKQQKLLDAETQENLRFVLSERRGRAFLWWLLGATGINESTFNTNALVMAKDEGRRGVGNMVLAEILEADENSYLTMQSEAMARDKQGREPEQENEDE